MRNTFYKVGESLLVRRELELEKQLKEKMIHSVMPPSVAQWLMSNTAEEGNDDDDDERVTFEPTRQLQVGFQFGSGFSTTFPHEVAREPISSPSDRFFPDDSYR